MSGSLGQMGELLTRLYQAPDRDRCDRTTALCRYAGGDMAETERIVFEQHLASCDDCSADWRTFEQTAAAWTAEPTSSPSWLQRAWQLMFRPPMWAIAGATMMLMVAIWLRSTPIEQPADLRLKGSWMFHVAVERDGQRFRGQSGMHLETGDRLGFFFSAQSSGFLMVLYASLDEPPLKLYPADSETAAAVSPGQEQRLLDGALLSPGQDCEWVLGFFSAKPFTWAEAQQAAGQMLAERRGCRLPPGSISNLDTQVYEVRR